MRVRLNDPYLDSQLTLQVFTEQRQQFLKLVSANPDLLTVWHWLTTVTDNSAGFDAFFTGIRGLARPAEREVDLALSRLLEANVCATYGCEIRTHVRQQSWPLAYALAWLSVAGGNSVLPPWVRHQFPEAGRLVRRLRDRACADPGCGWCRERHDAKKNSNAGSVSASFGRNRPTQKENPCSKP